VVESPPDINPVRDCWNQIGVWGDRSCPELAPHIHCNNCPVYAAAGRSFLDRDVEETYANSWMSLLSTTQESVTAEALIASDAIMAMVFRLGEEWLALPSRLLSEVTDLSPIHWIPHRSNSFLRGLVNIRGELQLCIALEVLLGLPSPPESPALRPCFLVIEQDQQTWVFSVDELQGLRRLPLTDLTPAAVTVTKGTSTYTQSVLVWQDQHINLLDPELLLAAIQRRAKDERI
jgi:chemotaxis-related protein WspD